jgi:hypothetical protein
LSVCSLAGRLRGRPGRPRGPLTGATASMSCSSSIESWVLAADRRTASGIPVASISRWYLDPGLPRSTGFAPTSSPTPRPHTHAVDGRSGPVDLVVVAQPVQQPMVQGLPHPGLLPVPQPPPAGHAAAAAQLLGREQPPGHPGPQHLDDAAQHRAVLEPGPAALGMRRRGWQQRLDGVPDLIGTSCSAMVGVVMAAHHPCHPPHCETTSNSTPDSRGLPALFPRRSMPR